MRELNVVELNVVNGGGDEVNAAAATTATAGAGILSSLWNYVPSGKSCLTTVAGIAALAAVSYAAYYGYNQYYGSNEAAV